MQNTIYPDFISLSAKARKGHKMNKVTLIGRTTKEIKLEKYGKGKDAGVYAKVTLAIRAAKDNNKNSCPFLAIFICISPCFSYVGNDCA